MIDTHVDQTTLSPLGIVAPVAGVGANRMRSEPIWPGRWL
jgi:hypothetical protein